MMSVRPRLVVCFLAAGAVCQLPAAESVRNAGEHMAARTAAPAAALSALDHVEIEQLVHRLHYTLDYCVNGGLDFAALFIEGGQFVIDEGDGRIRVLSTHEQLAKLAGGLDCDAVRKSPRSYVVHAAANLIIEPMPGGARGTSYAVYPANKGQYMKPELAGQVGLYLDEYVRTPAGWRFKSRRHVMKVEPGQAPPLAH
jgi:hypothetical protein